MADQINERDRRITLQVGSDLLEQIDAVAEQDKKTRNEWIRDALCEKLPKIQSDALPMMHVPAGDVSMQDRQAAVMVMAKCGKPVPADETLAFDASLLTGTPDWLCRDCISKTADTHEEDAS